MNKLRLPVMHIIKRTISQIHKPKVIINETNLKLFQFENDIKYVKDELNFIKEQMDDIIHFENFLCKGFITNIALSITNISLLISSIL